VLGLVFPYQAKSFA